MLHALRDVVREIDQAVAKLPARQKRVIRALYLDAQGQTWDAVAEAEGVSYTMVAKERERAIAGVMRHALMLPTPIVEDG